MCSTDEQFRCQCSSYQISETNRFLLKTASEKPIKLIKALLLRNETGPNCFTNYIYISTENSILGPGGMA